MASIFIFMTIKEWIDNNGSYRDGIALMHELGIINESLSDMLYRPFIPKSAKEELQKLLTPYVGQQPMTPPPNSAKVEPPYISSLRKKAVLLLKKRDQARSQLKVAETDEQRYELAKNLMDELIPSIDETYGYIKQYEKEGVVPNVQEEDIIQQTVKKMLKLQSLKPRISRLKKMLSGVLTEKERQTYEKELLDKELLVQQIRAELQLD